MMGMLGCVLMSLLVMVADGFVVHGSSGPLVAPLGSSVVLPCYVDKLSSMKGLEVEWRRADSNALVHLFLDGESRPESQEPDYQDRAHFFTDQIQHGNFSLRLDNLTAEDEGRYTCRVYSQEDSGEVLVQLKHERFLVLGSDRSVSAYDGEDVTLNCSLDSHVSLEDVEVSWTRTDGGILVLLFQDNQTFSDSVDEQYRDRAEFFTAEISKGNFSLRLKSVRIEDKGVYMCQVSAGVLSANVTVELEQLGFSSWHIAVLFFCIAAGLAAVLLLVSLIWCRMNNAAGSISKKVCDLQLSLVFCPNICMFLAFMLWGFTEASLNETITCCALYILRPFMLIWAMPYLNYLQGNLKAWIKFFKITRELAIFTVVFYSALFAHGWRLRAHDASIVPRVAMGISFGVIVLLCLLLSRGFKNKILHLILISCLSVCQMSQLMFTFGFSSLGNT
ncbi:CD276 antigen-like [Puntigrus tetrazona]|uniref:CD276 antigen-like n=1 Tax=Puntigrus tetrazona TaxID=1606681 RepID=UPI001C88F224|nr:CD276 antigen-like [Puntigrus tetrazona]